MKKVTIFIIIVAVGTLLFILINNFKNKTGEEVNSNSTIGNPITKVVRPSESVQHKYSMKQIDSVSANLNYKFTIENKVPDSVAILSEKNKETKSKMKK